MQIANLERPKSIAGAVIAGLGMSGLYENLASVAADLSHALGSNGSHAIGLLPATILTVSSHQGQWLHSVIHVASVSAWPILFVLLGLALCRDAVRGKLEQLGGNTGKSVDLAGPALGAPSQSFAAKSEVSRRTASRRRSPINPSELAEVAG